MTNITPNTEASLNLQLLKCLAEAGYSRKRDDTKISFVLGIVFNHDGTRAIGLVKQKGPEFLHGKMTYPGGRREETDLTLEARTSDELLEEANTMVSPDQWTFVAQSADVTVFASAIADVSMARTLELEPVFQFEVQLQLDLAEKRPDMFAPDFIALTRAARHLLGF